MRRVANLHHAGIHQEALHCHEGIRISIKTVRNGLCADLPLAPYHQEESDELFSR